MWRSQPLGLACVYWLSVILIFMLAQSGTMNNTLLLTLPGYLLVGLVTNFVLTHDTWHPLGWLVTGGLFLVLFLILVNTGRMLRVIVYDPRDVSFILVMLMGIILVMLMLYIVMTYSSTAVTQGVFLAFLAFFAFITWGNAWWLGHEAANDPRERWVASGTDQDVRLLAATLESLSNQFSNANADLDIASSVDTPVLRWYLRDFNNAYLGDTLPVTAVNDVLITPLQAEMTLGESYSGQDFGLAHVGLMPQQTPLSVNTAVNTLKWWLFRDSDTAVQNEQIILWVRGDLTQP